MSVMIRFEGVSHRFGDRTVLRRLDLTLAERRIAVIGANGSGKSTFARLLNGLLVPTEGRVLVSGLDTRSHGTSVRRKVGFVFQNPDNQIVYPVVEEDVAFALKPLKLSAAERAARIDAVLARYRLEGLRYQPSHLLSGGEKQLLAIAGVLVADPEAVVFDEPTTLLDLRNKRRVAQAIDALAQAVILVTHDLELARRCERVIVFDEGRIAADDAPGPAIDRYLALMT